MAEVAAHMSYAHHTLLVVDDEPEILDSLRRTLRDESYRILTTTSANEALRRIEEGGIDIVLTDLDMPEMSGLDLVRHVRRSAPDVVRMLLTGHASLDSALEAINEGEVHRYLTKPWSKGELRECIRQALDRLDELRRAADAGRRALVRDRLLAELEREHPGLTSLPRGGDVYVIDPAPLDALLAELGDLSLIAFFDPGPRR
jgi:two-component system, probable response regulator PhcQ